MVKRSSHYVGKIVPLKTTSRISASEAPAKIQARGSVSTFVVDKILPSTAGPSSGKSTRRRKVDDESVSRRLSGVLRHDAQALGLSIRADGYVKVSELLATEWFASRGVSAADVERIVKSNAKQRFGLDCPDGDEELHIRARQGHSLKVVQDAGLLQTVESAEELPVLCHGTFLRNLPRIKKEGLKTMGRNHIHLVSVDLASEEHRGAILSGTRGECDVIIYVDAEAAMAEGIEFQWSENDVVLTRGHDNVLPPHLLHGVAQWDWHEEQWTYGDLA